MIQLITDYPEFRKMYEEVYQLCLNTEKVMSMFSKELQELDRNTVRYMIDEMQNTINTQENTINELGDTLQERENTITKQDSIINEMKQQYQEALEEIKKLKSNQ